MRIVNDNDVRTFTDEGGDTLTVLAYVRQRDLEHANDLQTEHALESAKKLGMSIAEAMEHAKKASEGDEAAARERMKDAALPAPVRRYRLEAIARELMVGGEKFGGNAILETYERMDVASAKWVDDQVAVVWGGAVPSDETRES